MAENSNRKLTEEEVELVAKKVTETIKNDLYVNVGSGILALAWRGVILIVIVLAVYGMNHGFFK